MSKLRRSWPPSSLAGFNWPSLDIPGRRGRKTSAVFSKRSSIFLKQKDTTGLILLWQCTTIKGRNWWERNNRKYLPANKRSLYGETRVNGKMTGRRSKPEATKSWELVMSEAFSRETPELATFFQTTFSTVSRLRNFTKPLWLVGDQVLASVKHSRSGNSFVDCQYNIKSL